MSKVIIKMPKLSDSMTSGVLVAWNKEAGDDINIGDVFYEVETDKVVSQVESDYKGKVLSLLVEEGDEVEPGTALAEIMIAD